MSIVGYVRASTARQVDSPRVQEEIIRKYAEQRGLCKYEDVVIYSDPATSGTTTLREREAGSILCRRLNKGDHLIFGKFDRGFRSLRDFCNTIDIWIKDEINVHIVNFPGGQIDFLSPVGKMLMRMLATFAEFDNDLRRERIIEAKAARKHFGIRDARHAPFGYQWAAKRSYNKIAKKFYHCIEANETEREVARKVVLMKNTTSMNFADIARALEGVVVPGITKITGDVARRYYQKMVALELVDPQGLPMDGWVDDKKALALTKQFSHAAMKKEKT